MIEKIPTYEIPQLQHSIELTVFSNFVSFMKVLNLNLKLCRMSQIVI